MTRFTVMLFVLVLFLSGCLPANLPQAPTETPQPAPTFTIPPATQTPPADAITLDVLKNFTYTIEDFKTQAVLKDGAFSNDQIRGQLIEPVALGDLNGDGLKDAAVVLAFNSGGSGTFFYLIAVLDQNGAPVQAASSAVGDRQVVKNLQIADGRIILDFLIQGPKDPLCCASQHRLRNYLLENGALRLASEQILDSPTIQATPLTETILIDQPADGKLTTPLQISGRISQVPPEKKLAYSVTDLNDALLAQGEIPLEGEPGKPGVFTFEINLGAVSPSVIQVEIVDSTGGVLRGRSTILLIAK